MLQAEVLSSTKNALNTLYLTQVLYKYAHINSTHSTEKKSIFNNRSDGNAAHFFGVPMLAL